jgi:hypothetical protein
MRRTASALVVVLVVGACGASTPSPTPSSASPAVSSAPATSAPPTTPPRTETPSPSPSPTEAALPSYATTGDCSIEMIGDPVMFETMYFSGEGFAPDTYLDVEFETPDRPAPYSFDGEGNGLLLTADDGRLERWDVTANQPNEVGLWRMTFTDGTCEVTLWFEVTAD